MSCCTNCAGVYFICNLIGSMDVIKAASEVFIKLKFDFFFECIFSCMIFGNNLQHWKKWQAFSIID